MFEKPVELEERYFVEIHDLAPWVYEEDYLQKLDDYLDSAGVNKREYFLIPANRDDLNALEHNPEFVDYVKQKILGKYVLGHHGLLHWPMDTDNWVFEFTYLNEEDTRRKCEEAMRIHKKIFGCLPDGGEAPPNSSFSAEAMKTFLEYYPYVCVYRFVFIRDKPPLMAQAFTPTWEIKDAEESIKTFKKDLEYYNPAVVRITLHPHDTRSEDFEEAAQQVFNLIEDKRYEHV